MYFLSAKGEMAELMRSKDWSQSPLGQPDQWPNSLKTMVSVILHNPIGMYIVWGTKYIQLYNDAFRPILGSMKHPKALGISASETFSEIWDTIEPMFEAVMKGTPVRIPDFMVPLNREGYMEDCYFDFSYSPIQQEDGEIGGILVTVIETTNRKRAEDSLKESEERFRTMAEGTDVLVAVGDETSNAIYFNRAWVEITGRPMAELLKFGWADLIHPEDRDTYVKIYLDAFKQRIPFTGEFRVKNKEGDFRWLLATGTPRFRQDGSFVGYISSSIDITERKNVEKRLLEGEHLLKSVVNNAPFPIGVYVGKEMRIELANQAILDVWGKGNDVIGKSYMEILPELDNQEIFQQLEGVLETGTPFHAKNQRVDIVVDNKLQSFYFNYSFTPLYDASGRIYGVMNTAAEVTDLNIANMKVKESEMSLRQTILQAPVAMCILRGPNHVLELANDRMYELWGKPAEALLNKPIFEAISEASDQGFEDLLHSVYTTGKTVVAEGIPVKLPRNGDVETVYINVVYAAYREAEGDISGILVVAVDVTPQVIARRRIEEVVESRTKELADANKNLQKSNAELAQFAYIASHDLQEPLRKISNFTQMLQNRARNAMDEQSRTYLDKINNSSTRMHTMIRDVLTYSELTKKWKAFEEVDLNEVVKNVLQDYELAIEQKGASLRFDNLPIIEAIPLQMSQLFGNMLGNSLKFSRKGIPPIITISTSQLSDQEKTNSSVDQSMEYVKIVVRDNGIGFKEDYSEKIFDIFQRLHRKSEYEGTGIGLAMCKRIAMNHHGDLYAQGSSENGAVFTILLPVRQNK